MLYPTTCVGLRYGWARRWMIAVFLESMVTCAVGSPGGSPYFQVSADRTCLTVQPIPTPLNALFRQCAAVSLLCPCVSAGSAHESLHVLPSGSPKGLPLGPGLP